MCHAGGCKGDNCDVQRTHWSDAVVPKYDPAKGCLMSGLDLLAEALPDRQECQEVSNLLTTMLQTNPANRPSAQELLQDPWLCKNCL